MNTVILSGRLTKDPEVKTLESGSTVLSFRLAVDNNDREKTTSFVDCKAWGTKADFIGKWFSKGHPIEIVGKIKTGTYEKNGEKRNFAEVLVNEVGFVVGSSSKREDDSEEEVSFT